MYIILTLVIIMIVYATAFKKELSKENLEKAYLLSILIVLVLIITNIK